MIGIITAPVFKQYKTCGESYLYTAYINWVEMSGEQAVIIPYDIPEKKLSVILSRINGVVWVGGAIGNKKKHTKKQYDLLMNTIFFCYQYAVKENDKGNYYPIWSTCLGFDILIMFVNEQHNTLYESLSSFSLHGEYPCEFTNTSSRLKKWFSPSMREQMKQPCVFHNHIYGNKNLSDKVTVVSFHDKFINMIEFKDYPFYGVQFHPEQPQSELAIKISYQFSLFFKQECDKNKNIWKWEVSDFKKKKILL